MPSSYADSFPPIVHCIIKRNPRRVLDVGPGWGKYGLACREYLPALELIDAVEVPQGRLRTQQFIYDTVHIGDVRFAPAAFFQIYDLVLLIDVIEHLPLGAGHELLQRLRHNGTDVLVATPTQFFVQHVDHNPHEEHLSFWGPKEFGPYTIGDDVSTDDAFIHLLKGNEWTASTSGCPNEAESSDSSPADNAANADESELAGATPHLKLGATLSARPSTAVSSATTR